MICNRNGNLWLVCWLLYDTLWAHFVCHLHIIQTPTYITHTYPKYPLANMRVVQQTSNIFESTAHIPTIFMLKRKRISEHPRIHEYTNTSFQFASSTAISYALALRNVGSSPSVINFCLSHIHTYVHMYVFVYMCECSCFTHVCILISLWSCSW